jgi:hypothetical protein
MLNVWVSDYAYDPEEENSNGGNADASGGQQMSWAYRTGTVHSHYQEDDTLSELRLFQVPVVSIEGSVADTRSSSCDYKSVMGGEGALRSFYDRSKTAYVTKDFVDVLDENSVDSESECHSSDEPRHYQYSSYDTTALNHDTHEQVLSPKSSDTMFCHGAPCHDEELDDTDQFQAMYSSLRFFLENFGHTNVPKVPSWFLLGSWVEQLRKRKKVQSLLERGINVASDLAPLCEEHIQMLDNLGFSWTGENEPNISDPEACEYADVSKGSCSTQDYASLNSAAVDTHDELMPLPFAGAPQTGLAGHMFPRHNSNQIVDFVSSQFPNTLSEPCNYSTSTRPVMDPSRLAHLAWDEDSSSNNCFDQGESRYAPRVTSTHCFEPLSNHAITFPPIKTSESVPNDHFGQVQEVFSQMIDVSTIPPPEPSKVASNDSVQSAEYPNLAKVSKRPHRYLEAPSSPLIKGKRKMRRTSGIDSNAKLEGHDCSEFETENADAEQTWAMQFKRLSEFKRKTKHCSVPARYIDDPKLGHWVMTQRRQYHLMKKGKPTRMTSKKIDQLEQLGFQWSVRPEPVGMWNKRFGELKDFKKLHGDCLVPQRYTLNPQLGTWVNTQRRHYKLLKEEKRSCMTQERLQELEEVGFVWSTIDIAMRNGDTDADYFYAYMRNEDAGTDTAGVEPNKSISM